MVNLSNVVRSLLDTAVSLGKGVVHETEHVVSAVVHTAEQPVAGLYNDGKKVAQSLWDVVTFGGRIVNLVLGTVMGYVAWEMVRYIAPNWSSEVSDIVTAPFRKRRRVQ